MTNTQPSPRLRLMAVRWTLSPKADIPFTNLKQLQTFGCPDQTPEHHHRRALDNYADGPAWLTLRVSGPTQMVLSPNSAVLYIADRNNNRIRVSTDRIST